MRSIFYILLFLSFYEQPLFSQCEDGKLTREAWSTISNNHRANTAFTYGMVSYQSLEDNFYYDSPEDSLFYLGYSKALWVGAKDPAGNLKLAANTFPTIARNDFIPGPLDRQTGLPIDTLCGTYNRVWKITQFDIFNHQLNFQAGTLNLSDIPADILEWPAQGNPYLELAPDFDLAPFHDELEDGIYDPLTGDYPITLEEQPEFIPSEFSFVVYNDKTLHTYSQGQEIIMEFHQMNYVVNCLEDTESDHTVFTRIKYKYLGQETLSELKISLFEDNDLACNLNDYTGCNTDLNCSYFYNKGGETFVGSCHDFDVPDDNGAVRSTVFLNHDMKSFKHFYLLGVGDTLIPGIDPTGPLEHYNNMSGLWRDGEPQTVGGNGYDQGSTEETLFAFPDRPDLAGWSMETADIPMPLDVRALTTLIDERDVAPGAEGVIDFADHFLYDTERKKLEVFQVWPDKINQLKAEYASILDGSFACSGGIELCEVDCVWPGDANNDNAVTGKDLLFIGVLSGRNITDGISRGVSSTDWFGFNSDEWSTEFMGINAKYSDVNGSGTINETDLFLTSENFGLTRNNYVPPQELLEQKVGNNTLVVKLEVNEVDLSTAELFDRIVETEIHLEGLTDEALGAPLHGLSFDLRFDTNMITPFIILNNDEQDLFQYEFSYLDGGFRDGNELRGDNRIQYAFTNHNGENIIEGGLLEKQNMHVKVDAVTANLDGRDTLIMKFYNVCAFNAAGEEISFGASYDTLIITNMIVDPDVISKVDEVNSEPFQASLFPNPVTATLHCQLSESLSGKVIIRNLQGVAVAEQEIREQSAFSVQAESLAGGLYIFEIMTKSGARVVKTFVKTARN